VLTRGLIALAVLAVTATSFLLLERSARAQEGRTITMTRVVTAADFGRYLYLPFEMPDDVERVEVELTKESGTAVTGLGVFDERGAEYGSEGFRGIYGEEFQEFFIEEDDASPAFVPGPIESGRWTVIVPVFRAAADRITVTVKLNGGESEGGSSGGDGTGGGGGDSSGDEGSGGGTGETGGGNDQGGGGQTDGTDTRELEDCPDGPNTEAKVGDDIEQVNEEEGWYRGDLHDHTTHSSDSCNSGSAKSPEQFLDAADDAGLDFLSLTDHNVSTQNRNLEEVLRKRAAADRVLVMPGLEMTNWFHGHATVTGLEPGEWLDWRQRPRPAPTFENEKRIDAFIDAVEGLGVYTSAAHPSFAPTIDWEFFQEAEARPELLPDGLEVWTGPFQPDDDATIERWDEFLNRATRDERFRIVANGASDVHGFDNKQGFALGHPTTVVHSDSLSKDAVVESLEAGRSFVTCLPDGPELYLSATAGEGDEDPDNDQRQIVGGTILGAPSDTSRFSILVRGGGGRVLVILRDGQPVSTTPITDNQQTVTIEQPIGPEGGYVRAELRDAPETGESPIAGETGMNALTNPIFLRPGVPDSAPDPDPTQPPAPDGEIGTASCPPQQDEPAGDPGTGESTNPDRGESGGAGRSGEGRRRSSGNDSGRDDDDDGGDPVLGIPPVAPLLGPPQPLIRLFAKPSRSVPGKSVRYRFRAMRWAPDQASRARRGLPARVPVSGASVTFLGKRAVTDARGYVSFTARVDGLFAAASASKPGFRTGLLLLQSPEGLFAPAR